MIGIVSFAAGSRAWIRAGRRLEKELKFLNSDSVLSKVYFSLDDLKMENPDLLFAQNHLKGCGYWIWKPYTVLRFLDENPDVESVMYMDAGCDINEEASTGSFLEFYSIYLRKSGLFFNMPDIPEWKFSKRSLSHQMSATDEIMTDCQIAATVFILKREFAIELCSQWLQIMRLENYKMLRDSTSTELDGFIAHRHDQSILSLLIKKYHTDQVLIEDLSIFAIPNSFLNIARNRSSLSTSDNRSIARIIKLFEKIEDRLERLIRSIFHRCRENQGA